MSTTTEQNKAIVRRFIDEWNSRQPDAFDDLIAQDVVRHCEATPGVEARSLDQVKEFLRQDTAVFPDSVPIAQASRQLPTIPLGIHWPSMSYTGMFCAGRVCTSNMLPIMLMGIA